MEEAWKSPRDQRPVEDLLKVRTSTADGHTLLTVDGAVDLATAPRLRDSLDDALRYRPDTILVDLAAATYVGSHGLAVLLDAHADAARSGTALVLVLGENGLVRRILAITGTDKVFTIDTAQDASTSESDTASHH